MLSIALYLLSHAMLLSLHLSGGSFPRPLSAQEEKKYVEQMLAGDLEARNMLVEHNLRLVAHIANNGYSKRPIRAKQRGKTAVRLRAGGWL